MTTAAAGSTTASTRRVTADDGVQLHVDIAGDGQPLVVLHGLGYAGWAAAPLAERLRDRFTVWSIDTRGAGQSDKPAGPYSIQRFADDAVSVLDTIGQPVHLLGYSMGGYVAQTVARDHPELIRTLTLLSTSGGGATACDVPATTRAVWEHHAHLEPAEFARATMPLSFSDGWTERHTQQFEHLLGERLRHPTPPHAWRAQYEAAAAFLRDGDAAERISAPTLIIHGANDRVVPVHNGRDLHRRIDGSRYHELPAGHLVHVELPQGVADLFTAFVDGQPPNRYPTPNH